MYIHIKTEQLIKKKLQTNDIHLNGKQSLKQWWSTIPPILTKQAITSQLDQNHLLNTKRPDSDIYCWNPGPEFWKHKNMVGLNWLC